MKILIIDDSKATQLTLRNILCNNFTNVDIKYLMDGFEAIFILKSEKFDLILCDYNMPYLNGDEAIRAFGEYIGKTPTILLTTEFYSPDEVHDMGFTSYVRKDEMISIALVNEIKELLAQAILLPDSNITSEANIKIDKNIYL